MRMFPRRAMELCWPPSLIYWDRATPTSGLHSPGLHFSCAQILSRSSIRVLSDRSRSWPHGRFNADSFPWLAPDLNNVGRLRPCAEPCALILLCMCTARALGVPRGCLCTLSLLISHTSSYAPFLSPLAFPPHKHFIAPPVRLSTWISSYFWFWCY